MTKCASHVILSDMSTEATPSSRPFIVIRTPARRFTREVADVHVTLSDGSTAKVAVYGPEERWGQGVQPPTVNWSAIGQVSPEDALAYAGAIALAAAIAPTLAPPTGDADDE